MTYVVTESCIRCKYADCARPCPVDGCFRAGPNFVVIDPVTCIDCGLCIPECPVEAIYAVADVPADQQVFIALNAELAALWPGLDEATGPLPDADQWSDVKDKLQYLER